MLTPCVYLKLLEGPAWHAESRSLHAGAVEPTLDASLMEFHIIMRSLSHNYEIFSYNYRIRWLVFFSMNSMHFCTNMWLPGINFEFQQRCFNAWLYYIVYSNNLKGAHGKTNKSLVLVLFYSDGMLLRAGVTVKTTVSLLLHIWITSALCCSIIRWLIWCATMLKYNHKTDFL